MPQEVRRRDKKLFSPPATRLGWERHWDPHPICWLEGTLTVAPYNWRPLGMRSCPGGGVAITLPGTQLLIGTVPVDRHRVTWNVHTHDPDDSDGHEPIDFGTFTWVRLDRAAFDQAESVFHLPDGSTLTVAECRGQAEIRYRIVSRADPARLVPGTETWADLPAIEQIAERVYARMVVDAAGSAEDTSI